MAQSFSSRLPPCGCGLAVTAPRLSAEPLFWATGGIHCGRRPIVTPTPRSASLPCGRRPASTAPSPSLTAAWPQPYSTRPGHGARRRSDRQRVPSSGTNPRHGWPMTTVPVLLARPMRWRRTSAYWRLRGSNTWCCDLGQLTFGPSSDSRLRSCPRSRDDLFVKSTFHVPDNRNGTWPGEGRKAHLGLQVDPANRFICSRCQPTVVLPSL